MEIKKLLRAAEVEADWLRYYCESKSKNDENFDDIYFYDRMNSIGYAKRNLPLYQRCVPFCVTSDVDVLKSNIDGLRIIYECRNHSKNIYTPLEYFIGIKEGKNLIEIIKK